MTIPYRTRRMLRSWSTCFLILLMVAVLVLLCWLLWLDRFVVYTRNGAIFDFSQTNKQMSGQLAVPTEPGPTVSIHYGDEDVVVSTELPQLLGYYITLDELTTDLDGLMDRLKALPAGTPVMLDVKSITGAFYYTSSVGSRRNSKIDPGKMDELIALMNENNLYSIARLPAFRDYYYGLNHVSHGLPTSGGYLWMDESRCYWLNPASKGTQSYLAQILTELKALGFREAVFYDFCFPNTQSIVFKGNRQEAIENAAKTLVNACASDTFAVSFVGSAEFALPEGRSRLYLENIAASDCDTQAGIADLTDPHLHLVFLTDVHDTRYNTYSVLRPLSSIS